MHLVEAGNLDGQWEQVREAVTLTHENQAGDFYLVIKDFKKCVIIIVIIKP